MIPKFIITFETMFLLLFAGCSSPRMDVGPPPQGACGSCYWEGRTKEASYQKKPDSPIRDWNTGVIYQPPSKHQRVWNGAPPPFGGR
ncbi:MAG: hypothetical protein QF560_20075 [SAR324 cluster bacterium]|nr:hypothetical protein [Deltaproteobacteria bacterium]MDP7140661.1 hypothetical protein [SAR324 cluster bacterium]MDP7498135.1 hypothetical protein [SAR324 cluster bacterium]